MHLSDFSLMHLPAPLRDLYLLWRGAEDRIPPRLASMTFHHLNVTVDALAVTEILHDANGAPSDLCLIYTSTGLRPKLAEDYRGRRFSQLEGKGPGSVIWAAYMATARTQLPHRVTLPYVGPLPNVDDTTELFLPLRDDRGRTSFVLAGIVLNEANRTMPPQPLDSGDTIPPTPRSH
jgi:hypothetical protein